MREVGKLELQIVECLKTDKSKAIELINKNYSQQLLRVIRIVEKDEAKSKDVLQLTLLAAWMNADKYNSERAGIYTWLIQIARRKSIDNWRNENKTNMRSNLARMDKETNLHLRPNVTQFNTNTIGLMDNLNKIEEKYALILRLKYLEGYTQEQISENINIPLGTVKSRQKIALTRLRKVYL